MGKNTELTDREKELKAELAALKKARHDKREADLRQAEDDRMFEVHIETNQYREEVFDMSFGENERYLGLVTGHRGEIEFVVCEYFTPLSSVILAQDEAEDLFNTLKNRLSH